jgi:RNA-directed DNA polymerase
MTIRTKNHKPYSIKQSPFFAIKGKKQFEKIIGYSFENIIILLNNKNNYRIFINSKSRTIQNPCGDMEKIHKRIARLLSRIELPDYIHSKKGSSYITNAAQHIGHHSIVKTDIRKYYPSTNYKIIFNMFKNIFKCAGDIANILANICCYNGFLPTGSSLSGYVAYFSAKNMFDEIAILVKSYSCNLTVYVDDITISGDKATKKLLFEVRQIIKKHQHTTSEKKSKTFSASSIKEVTGVIVTRDAIKVPNRRLKLLNDLEKKTRRHPENQSDLKNLNGRRSEANAILNHI